MRLTTRGRPWHDKRDLDNSLLVGLSAPAAAAPRYPGDRGPGGIWTTDRMPAVWVKVATAIRMRTSPFGANGIRTVRNVGGIITAIASRQWPANIAAAGQGIGQPFENARRIDAVGLG